VAGGGVVVAVVDDVVLAAPVVAGVDADPAGVAPAPAQEARKIPRTAMPAFMVLTSSVGRSDGRTDPQAIVPQRLDADL
jgi:hypothetical protein